MVTKEKVNTDTDCFFVKIDETWTALISCVLGTTPSLRFTSRFKSPIYYVKTLSRSVLYFKFSGFFFFFLDLDVYRKSLT